MAEEAKDTAAEYTISQNAGSGGDTLMVREPAAAYAAYSPAAGGAVSDAGEEVDEYWAEDENGDGDQSEEYGEAWFDEMMKDPEFKREMDEAEEDVRAGRTTPHEESWRNFWQRVESGEIWFDKMMKNPKFRADFERKMDEA
jgi:hypothetical protein